MNTLLITRNLPAIIAGLFLAVGLLIGWLLGVRTGLRYKAGWRDGVIAERQRWTSASPAPDVQQRPDGRPQPQGTYRPTRITPPVAGTPTEQFTAVLPPAKPRPGVRGWLR